MKKLTGTLIGLCCLAGLYAQNTFRISGGTRLTTSGTVQMVLGTGNLINNGTIGGTTGTLVFAGPITYSGTGSTMIQNFTIAHTSSSVSKLNAPISVVGTTNLMFGNFDANNNLMIRSDLNPGANLILAGAPVGHIDGIIVKATSLIGQCPNFLDTLSVNVSGPLLRFQWQSAVDSINWSNIAGAAASTYATNITRTTFFRCIVDASNTTFIDTLPGLKIVLDSPKAAITGANTIQLGNTTTLTGTTAGGVWSSSNSAVASVNTAGVVSAVAVGTATITYTVTNSGGCVASANRLITVSNGNKPNITITNPAAVCAPGSINLTAAAVIAGSDPGLTFKYFTNAAATTVLANPASVTASGTYFITGTDGLGVTSDPSPVVVTINALPSGTITSAQGIVLCGTLATLPLNLTGGSTYTWFKDGVIVAGANGGQLTVTGAGVYTASITSTAGCRANAGNSVTVTLITAPKTAFNFDSYCINRPVSFTDASVTTGSGPLNYQWSDDRGNSSVLTNPLAITYTQAGLVNMKLKVTPQICPALADSITRQLQIEIPTTALRYPITNVLINEALDLKARNLVNGNTYIWAPATGLSSTTVGNPRTTLTADQQYTITIRVPSSCITVDTVLVRIFDNRIYVPNVFTPNGDGINDKLFVNTAGIRSLHYFRVFNRYGRMVFQTTDATIGWDGRFNNEMQPMDTYIWIAEVKDQFGQSTISRGNITLLR